MSIEKQTVAEIEHLMDGINGDFPQEEKRGMWHRLKDILREVLELGNGMADEMRKDAERWERDEELQTPAGRQAHTRQA